MAQPDADSGELDEGERVGGAFLVSGGGSAVVLEFVDDRSTRFP
jgi:hypothetical protein